ncbi:hypothetical protein L6452_42198 [Arctium lappa]|uniref:Uncharacterized protein n=1 Tax=Arctium lappa TaxID=4217 RepID=A0ACB8XI02_ARCLA|nr:hypothetical protein L6452_42198 [Arctium lappa]
MEKENETKAEQVVNPWEVSAKGTGKIDYDKLIDQFGCQRLDKSFVDRVFRLTSRIPHMFLRRNAFFVHRASEIVSHLHGKAFKHALTLACRYLQEAFKVTLVIQLTDYEKCMWKNLTVEESKRLARENAKDIIACGFDISRTFIFSDFDYVGGQVVVIFCFTGEDHIGKISFPPVQVLLKAVVVCYVDARLCCLQLRGMRSVTKSVKYAEEESTSVAKPLVAKSHELSLAYDEYSLQKLEPPLVLQEFVNHGVLFKVYIVGDAIKVVWHFSLPDVSKRELSRSVGVFRFPRVSSAAQSADDADLDPCIAELPPRALLERLARELRRRLEGRKAVNLPAVGCRWWLIKAKHAQKVEKERLNWFSLCYGCTRKEMGATAFLDEREGMRLSIHPRLKMKTGDGPIHGFLKFRLLDLGAFNGLNPLRHKSLQTTLGLLRASHIHMKRRTLIPIAFCSVLPIVFQALLPLN